MFTREGINELEASIMVSKGMKKRGVGVMGLRHVKNPILLAREMLLHGEYDLEGGNGEHRAPKAEGAQPTTNHSNNTATTLKARGAQGHSQLHKYSAEALAKEWGLELVDPSYFFVQARWDEHIKGLEREQEDQGVASWDAEDFVPQGTCGAVALDVDGACAAATSTGGMTNKLTGRIGDTPTLGAGFWAEEWEDEYPFREENLLRQAGPALILSESLKGLVADCLPSLTTYLPVARDDYGLVPSSALSTGDRVFRACSMSGTGNGDSFLRINAVRTAAAIARYQSSHRNKKTSLREALADVAGPGGKLQESAGDRWKRTGEGEGGIIGIESTIVTDADGTLKHFTSDLISEFNCGGMWRAEINENGKAVARAWKDGQYDGIDAYIEAGEGKEYDVRDWVDEKASMKMFI